MRRGLWTDHPLLAERDSPAVVRVAELESIGMPRRSISRRCRPGGVWRSMLPGIVLLGNAVPTDEQRLSAALLHSRDGAMITGLWALRLHGLRQFAEPEDVHVLVPANRTIISSRFLTVERTTRLPAPHNRLGFPVAPVHRAVLDAARRSADYDGVLAMMAEAVQRRRCTAVALSAELRQGSRRGSAVPRRALTPLLGGARSVAEADAWNLWQGSGLPSCQWNVKLVDGEGRYIATPDAWVDDLGFAWEIDSRKHHSEDDDFADTLSRNARYVTAGVLVLQTLPVRLRTEPAEVLAELRAACAAAARRPRPDVHFGRK